LIETNAPTCHCEAQAGSEENIMANISIIDDQEWQSTRILPLSNIEMSSNRSQFYSNLQYDNIS